jgi:hypothetical protein
MTTCWICHEEIHLDSATCWPVEGTIGAGSHPIVPDAPAHHQCIVQAIGQRGPGGQIISGYQKGATRPNGSGLILRK